MYFKLILCVFGPQQQIFQAIQYDSSFFFDDAFTYNVLLLLLWLPSLYYRSESTFYNIFFAYPTTSCSCTSTVTISKGH